MGQHTPLFGKLARAMAATVPRTTDNAELAQLKQRFTMETQYATVDQAQCDDIEAHTADLLKAQDWSAVSQYLTGLDQSRTKTPSGQSHINIATFYIRSALAETFAQPSKMCADFTFGYSDDTIAAIDAAYENASGDYMVAAICALINIDQGIINRTRLSKVPGALNVHFAQARAIVTRYDPIAHDTPLMAAIQYRLCIGVDNGADRLASAFADWRDLDPGCFETLRHHALNCLPHMFGGADCLENAARASGDHADYAVMMIQALRFDAGVADILDPFVLLDGIDAHLARVHGDAHCVTVLMRDLIAGITAADAAGHGDQMTHLRRGIGPVLRKHLTVFCSPAWQGGDSTFMEWAASAYMPELLRGGSVTIDRRGTVVIAEAGETS